MYRPAQLSYPELHMYTALGIVLPSFNILNLKLYYKDMQTIPHEE